MENNLIINVETLTKKFGNFIAVDNIELKIKKGEIFGLLGPNGAGKTTTMRMLCGLLLPTSANGYVNNFDIMKEPEKIKKTIGYVSQKFSLYEDLTLEENVNFFGGIYKVKGKERKEFVLQMLALEDKKNETVKLLSLGIKQRVALACAILHKPSILFLDEPTSGTDPNFKRSFWEIIYEMAKEGTTIILTTHYLDEALFCENLALIFKGKIIASGKPVELKEKYSNFFAFELEVDNFSKSIEILSEEGINFKIYGNLFRILFLRKEDVEIVSNIFKEKDILIKKMERVLPTLEDIFVFLTEGKL